MVVTRALWVRMACRGAIICARRDNNHNISILSRTIGMGDTGAANITRSGVGGIVDTGANYCAPTA